MIGRTEFADGKFHILKDTARIILFGNDAFLIWNTVFGCVYEIMSVTDYLNYRKNSKCDRKISFKSLVIGKAAIKSADYAFGDIVNAAATVAAAVVFVFLNDLS